MEQVLPSPETVVPSPETVVQAIEGNLSLFPAFYFFCGGLVVTFVITGGIVFAVLRAISKRRGG